MENRACERCGDEYPLTKEFFYTGGNGAYFQKYCKTCMRELDKQRRAKTSIKKTIYFVLNTKRALIKIGSSHNVRQRIGAIRFVGQADPLEVLGIHNGTVSQEYELHRMFKDYRVMGEWYIDCPEIRQYIADNCHMPDLSAKPHPAKKHLNQTRRVRND